MDDATPRQKVCITRLLMALKIREPFEEQPMSKGMAGRYIRQLEGELKSRKGV